MYRKKRILHLIDSAGLYGAERVILMLLSEFHKNDHDYLNILGCIRDGEDRTVAIGEEARRLGLEVEYFTMKRGLNPFGIYSILRFTNEKDIKLIHSHGYKTDIFFGLLPGCLRKVPIISTIHGMAKESGQLKKRLYEKLNIICLKRLDKLIAVSNAVKKDLENLGLSHEEIYIIYNGLNFNAISNGNFNSLKEELHLPPHSTLIGTIGRLCEEKGHSFFLEAASKIIKLFPESYFIIAGEGHLERKLKVSAHSLDLEGRLFFLGYRKDIFDVLASLDVFVLPSLTEGLPIVLLEAMYMRKGIVAFNSGGISEVIEHGQNGILVPTGDVNGLTEAVLRMLNDSGLKSNLSNRARDTVVNKFSSNHMFTAYKALYDILTYQKRGICD